MTDTHWENVPPSPGSEHGWAGQKCQLHLIVSSRPHQKMLTIGSQL